VPFIVARKNIEKLEERFELFYPINGLHSLNWERVALFGARLGQVKAVDY
jgi:hypothetical protein